MRRQIARHEAGREETLAAMIVSLPPVDVRVVGDSNLLAGCRLLLT